VPWKEDGGAKTEKDSVDKLLGDIRDGKVSLEEARRRYGKMTREQQERFINEGGREFGNGEKWDPTGGNPPGPPTGGGGGHWRGYLSAAGQHGLAFIKGVGDSLKGTANSFKDIALLVADDARAVGALAQYYVTGESPGVQPWSETGRSINKTGYPQWYNQLEKGYREGGALGVAHETLLMAPVVGTTAQAIENAVGRGAWTPDDTRLLGNSAGQAGQIYAVKKLNQALGKIGAPKPATFANRARAQGLTENPHRLGSFGKYDQSGTFHEVIRMDPASAARGEHIHLGGGKEHLPLNTPIPGEKP